MILFCITTILEPIVKIYEESFWVHSCLVELQRSSHWRCCKKKGVLKSFSKFTGKDVLFSRPATLLKIICLLSPYTILSTWKLEFQGKQAVNMEESWGAYTKNTPYFVFHFKNFVLCYIFIFFLDLNKTLMSQNLT